MLKEVLSGFISLLGPIATLSKDRRELKDMALKAISMALDETYLYYRDVSNGSLRNMDREAQLAKYWSAAAIPVRHFDEHLSTICDLKAEYWINPESYSETEVKELGIKLGDVRQAYRNMLRPNFQDTKRYSTR